MDAEVVEAFGYVLLGLLAMATVIGAVTTVTFLVDLRDAIKKYDPTFGAEMFQYDYWMKGTLAYQILGVRSATNWFERHGACEEVVVAASKAKWPFLGTISLAFVAGLIFFLLQK